MRIYSKPFFFFFFPPPFPAGALCDTKKAKQTEVIKSSTLRSRSLFTLGAAIRNLIVALIAEMKMIVFITVIMII